jgi:hypothetical protein
MTRPRTPHPSIERTVHSYFAVLVLSLLSSATGNAQLPRLERVLEIGCEDCGDARQLASNWDVAVMENGNVLVVDRDAPTLRMFDRTGRSLWTRGRTGSGPGEYGYAMRVALGPNGTLQVVDMRLRRLTRLGADGAVAQTLSFPFFPMGVAARGRQGEIVILTDDFRGAGTLERWLPTADAPARFASLVTPKPAAPTSASPSVAVAPNGDVAFLQTADRYEIHRLSAKGESLSDIVRDVPRPRRTPEEIAATRQHALRAGAQTRAALEGKTGGSGKAGLLPNDHGLEFKPHASADALRYDDAGRLWVRTMRGTGRTTVFDIFAPNAAYAGEVTVPLPVGAYSLAGGWLATASERADGVPIVVLWTVR